MMTFYSAVGCYRIRKENGRNVPYIQKLGKLYPLSIPEFVIWSSTLHYVRILGMNAQHGKHIKKKEAKLAFNNIFYLIGLIKAKENGTEATYRKPPYMSEAETRRQ